jgi:thioesterase domain-containing protein
LGREAPLGVEDDFFVAGGHSLSAVRLAGRVSAEFGAAVTLAQLIETPTIAAQARRLQAQGLNERETPPAQSGCMRLSGSGTQPLFCFHPALGEAGCYLSLSRAMKPAWEIFGVEARDALDSRDLSALAAMHADAVRRAAAGRPLWLLGWSLGGQVALETARHLQGAGESIRRVFLIDAFSPAQMRVLMEAQGGLLRAFALDWWESAGLSAARFPERLPSQEDAALQLLRAHAADVDLAADDLGDAFARFAALTQAALNPAPTRFDLPVTLIRAGASSAFAHGWTGLIPGLRVTTTPGTHADVLRAPNVERLAALIDGDSETSAQK